MLADFYIPRLSNDMKIAVSHIFQMLYRSLVPVKKNSVCLISFVLKNEAKSDNT